MAFEEHHATEAREWAEARFSPAEVEAAKPILDAFHFKVLEICLRGLESSLSYYDGRVTKTERAMGKIDYDLGPSGDGPELAARAAPPVPQGRNCTK